MARKSKNKTNKASVDILDEKMLPQNIMLIGERVEENKNIYIAQDVYRQIHKFTQNKTTNESGGMLVGTISEEFGKTNIVISGFIEAKHTEATPTTLTFTHGTWEQVHKEIEKKHTGNKIVGWIHTHPNFGIFLSEYDIFIHQNFFSEEYQVAYVVDPIQKIEGFYFWINGKIEKCKGFYIYDKTGVEITEGIETEEKVPEKQSHTSIINSILITFLTIAVALLVFANISANKEMKQLQMQQETLATSANQSLFAMRQMICSLETDVQNLKEQLIAKGFMAVPEADTSNEKESENGTADNNEELSENPGPGTLEPFEESSCPVDKNDAPASDGGSES